MSTGNLTNATAIGNGANVNASNKIRLGNTAVTVIEGQVAFTASSDKTKKENFQPVDGEEVLGKIRGFELSTWNFIGHDPKEFRHYGPMAQDFFAAFGHDGVGQIGSETTINSGDMAGILMTAVQALEKRTAELKQKDAQIAVLESTVEELKAQQASLRLWRHGWRRWSCEIATLSRSQPIKASQGSDGEELSIERSFSNRRFSSSRLYSTIDR